VSHRGSRMTSIPQARQRRKRCEKTPSVTPTPSTRCHGNPSTPWGSCTTGGRRCNDHPPRSLLRRICPSASPFSARSSAVLYDRSARQVGAHALPTRTPTLATLVSPR